MWVGSWALSPSSADRTAPSPDALPLASHPACRPRYSALTLLGICFLPTCRPFAPFKELGSWQGCVVCWSGEAAAATAGAGGTAAAASATAAVGKSAQAALTAAHAGLTQGASATCTRCAACAYISHASPQYPLLSPSLRPPSPPQTTTPRACCPATPATASTTRTAWSRRWRSRRCRR